MSYYFNGGEGEMFFYADRKTNRCDLNITSLPTGDEERAAALAELRAERPRLDEVMGALEAIGVDALDWLRRVHRSARFDDGRCSCGEKLIPLGWPAWIEEPWPSAAEVERELRAPVRTDVDEMEVDRMVSSALSTRALNLRIGNTHRRRPGSTRSFGLRREAKAWASEMSGISRAAAREAAEKAQAVS